MTVSLHDIAPQLLNADEETLEAVQTFLHGLLVGRAVGTSTPFNTRATRRVLSLHWTCGVPKHEHATREEALNCPERLRRMSECGQEGM